MDMLRKRNILIGNNLVRFSFLLVIMEEKIANKRNYVMIVIL